MMPDFDTITIQQCETLEDVWVKSYNGRYELNKFGPDWYDWDCTCKAYKYSQPEAKGCKHIRSFMAVRCTWHSQTGYPQTEDQRTNQICPNCMRPTVFRQFAV